MMPDVNEDFGRPAWLAPERFQWVQSPEAGVARVMLDRVGDEVAVATSLVRYAPDSRFPAHEHALGEEYLVLEGEFGDENGRYGPGTYVRNPPGSRHAPFSEPGCVIWVKLRQFHRDDQRQVLADVNVPTPAVASVVTELHRFQDETVTLTAAAPGTHLKWPPASTVQEVFVVSGSVTRQSRRLDAHGWLRLPAGEGVTLQALSAVRLLHKTRPAFAVPPVSSARSSASAGT
jgi:quercetin dioxygenase-like cupin family protein